jgi:hypothetical protein
MTTVHKLHGHLANALDKFVDVLGPQDGMMIASIAFVVDFDQHVAVAVLKDPLGGIVGRANDSGFIPGATFSAFPSANRLVV